MKNINVISELVPTEKIVIDRNETAVRLKISRSYENETINDCLKELEKVLSYKFAFVKMPITFKGDSICDLGFGDIVSRDLCRVLSGCSYAYIVGVTTGIGVDRLLAKLSITSQAKNFITDGLSSAAAESLCEYVDVYLRGNGKKPMRYSPGYGDMSLDYQAKILESINARDTLGITLNTSLLMTPVKSITAIMGIYDD